MGSQAYPYPQRFSTDDYLNAETYKYTRKPVTLAMTLIADAYRRADFFELEREQVFGTSWIAVGLLSDVEKPGQVLVTEVGGQSIIITRDKEMNLRAFYNVCRHRGAELVSENCTVRRFRCPYHSWGYDLQGNCIGTPLFDGSDIPSDQQGIFDMSDVREFDRADYGLFPVKVASWGFLIFVNLDPDAMSLETWLGDLPQRLANYQLDKWQTVRKKDYSIHANWKLINENYMEYYHLPWVHPELIKVSRMENHYRYQGRGMYTGMTTTPISDNADEGGWKGLAPFSKLSESESNSGRFICLFPNVSISILPNHVFIMLLKPVSHDHTLESTVLLTHPEIEPDHAIEQELDELMNFWDLVNVQDIEIVEAVQRGLSNKPYQGGRMCYHFEEPVHRFQNMVIDRMLNIRNTVPEGDNQEIVRMFGIPGNSSCKSSGEHS